MPNHNPESVYKKILENPKAPQHARIAALKFLNKPSLALLRRLATDPAIPGRLAALAADRFAEQIALKQLNRGDDAIQPIPATN